MRKHLMAGLVAGVLGAGAGCYDLFSDPLIFHVGGIDEVGGSGGGTGGTGGSPPGCTPTEDNKEIDGSCGVFVSSSLAGEVADGSKEKPYPTIGDALSAADGKPIYACGEVIVEALKVQSGELTLYGALDCANGWAYDSSKRTVLTAAADVVPLVVGAGAVAVIADVKVEAGSAQKTGGSSIAVIADDGATLELTRCELVAGDGKDGQDGFVGFDNIGPADSDDPEIQGNDGTNACSTMDMQFGGAAKENPYCPVAMGGPLGGIGGTGSVASGSAGDAQPMPSPETAQGGAGQPANDPMSLWNCGVGESLGGGQAGANGSAGTPGLGGIELGTITAEGYTGMAGATGGTGKPGQGGGGGGGAKGKTSCAGASGGGGGAGGCGGKGGTGGQPGGASMGLLLVNAKLTLDAVTISTGKGGKGGDGGLGQGGAIGGSGGKGGLGDLGAPATLPACNGGQGGVGGKGGDGGGGRGGPSVAIAFTGAPPAVEGVTFQVGQAGEMGLGEGPTGNAKAALACSTLRFDQGEDSCVK